MKFIGKAQNNTTIKDIPGFNGKYQVDINGNIFATERMEKLKSSRTRAFTRVMKRKQLKLINAKNGYVVVNLNKRQYLAHRLVLQTFVGIKKDKPQCNHINGNKHDNRLLNLEWVDRSENMLHAYNVLNIKRHFTGKFGVNHPASKKVQQLKDGVVVRQWNSITEAVNAGYEGSCITRCCQKEYHSHLGYNWKYL
jgi:hypothetical protein